MADFKTQADVWRALLDGETVKTKGAADHWKIFAGLLHRREGEADQWKPYRASTFASAAEFRLVCPELTSGDYDWAVEQVLAGKMVRSLNGWKHKVCGGIIESVGPSGNRYLGSGFCEEDGPFTLVDRDGWIRVMDRPESPQKREEDG